MPSPTLPESTVEIACIVDRSGSMQSVRSDAIGGFNAFLQAQREEPGEARLTLALFDHEYERAMDSVPLREVPDLTNATYQPGGNTALFDAIGRTLHDLNVRLKATPEEKRPGKVIVAILTDGKENASTDYTSAQTADAVAARRADGWEFVFLAANQDAVLSAKRVGIAAADAMSFNSNAEGTKNAFARMSKAVSARRKH